MADARFMLFWVFVKYRNYDIFGAQREGLSSEIAVFSPILLDISNAKIVISLIIKPPTGDVVNIGTIHA